MFDLFKASRSVIPSADSRMGVGMVIDKGRRKADGVMRVGIRESDGLASSGIWLSSSS